jgi:hypothetical protein
MTKFLKADNGEILTARTDLKSGRGKKHSGEMIKKKAVNAEKS